MNVPRIFRCEACKGRFYSNADGNWSKEDQLKEFENLFPGEDPEGQGSVCHQCWLKIMNSPEGKALRAQHGCPNHEVE